MNPTADISGIYLQCAAKTRLGLSLGFQPPKMLGQILPDRELSGTYWKIPEMPTQGRNYDAS